jgi:metallo-beta-lactamase family protein
MIVGYQAEGTLGRQLVDGARYVRIFGERVAVRATVYKLGGFSAHAGQTELLKWFNALAQVRPKVILTHGEEKARETMANLLRHRYGITPYLPLYGEVINI